jgi:hypothetical protein
MKRDTKISIKETTKILIKSSRQLLDNENEVSQRIIILNMYLLSPYFIIQNKKKHYVHLSKIMSIITIGSMWN